MIDEKPEKIEKVNDRVRHRTRPAEPFSQPGAYGRITRTVVDGPLRITPAYRSTPAMAFCQWGEVDFYYTWEQLSDLIMLGGKRER